MILRNHIRKTSDGCTTLENSETTARNAKMTEVFGRSIMENDLKMDTDRRLNWICGITNTQVNKFGHGFIELFS